MAVYATLQDLIDRFGDDAVLVASDRDRDGQMDTDVVDKALLDADAEIDTYVGQQYKLPLPTVPRILTKLAVDIAFHTLSPEADTATEHRKTRYDNAIALLRRIARGEVSLGIPQQSPVSIKPEVTSRPRRWGRDRRLT
ncbi:gp436 family protein [Marinobacter sp. OP 3.4]|uniref:gp436 family protein n=1 Tax=Marinobacter sp. OP 3.4 TaxID=3076501 RepID=UPI002E237686